MRRTKRTKSKENRKKATKKVKVKKHTLADDYMKTWILRRTKNKMVKIEGENTIYDIKPLMAKGYTYTPSFV
jgi:hypothetical protein